MIPIGEMNQRITLQDAVAVRDAYGGESVTWNDAERVWAKVVTDPGALRYLADQVLPEGNVVFHIRYLATVTTSRRLIWNGVPHQILSVLAVDGRRFDMQIHARSGVANG